MSRHLHILDSLAALPRENKRRIDLPITRQRIQREDEVIDQMAWVLFWTILASIIALTWYFTTPEPRNTVRTVVMERS